MIVAGLGFKRNATSAQIIDAIAQAFEDLGLEASRLGLLASGEMKRNDDALSEAGTILDVPVMIIDDIRLKAVAERCLTLSEASLKATGLPSLSEAAALVAAGANGRLIGPRLQSDGVTVALGTTTNEAAA